MADDCELSEAVLVRKMREGDADAFGALFNRYQRRLERAIRRGLPLRLRRKVSVADIVQDTCLVAFRRRAEFEAREDGGFGRWLARIATFRARETVRSYRQKRRAVQREVTRAERTTTGHFAGQVPSPSQAAITTEDKRLVQETLARLPEDYRQVLRLVFEERLAQREVAERMGRSTEAVKKLYGRALCRFKQVFQTTEDSGHDERGAHR